MGDALAWIYRKDWFERPEIQEAFQAEYGRALDVPKNWDELLEIAKFFQGREIDGKTRYGVAIYTERGSEGITMGVTSALYPWGFAYQDPDNPYQMEGFVNSPESVAALEFYKELFECCTPPGHTDAYMTTNLDAYKSGQVAMQMNWFAFFPGILKDPNVGGDKSGFFVNPPQNIEASVLGGQGISVVSYSDKQDLALEYIKWFAQPEVQKKWWALGGYSCHTAVLEDPGFADTAPFAAQFLDAMSNVKDFWQEPAYAELLLAMQKRVHDYVVADQGTAQEALDKLIEDWQFIFEDYGVL
jgi:multiple sugar transport system substrate-binding protein